MKKLLLLSSMSLFIIIFAGCADCKNESDYDLVGVTYDEFIAKSGIKSTLNAKGCENTTNHIDCTANLNNANRYGVLQGFVIQCTDKKFDLQETIHALFPQEAYKDDKFESCNDYYVYDFIAATHRNPTPHEIQSISVDTIDKNLWNVKINGSCYQWDVTNTQYKMQ